MLDRIYSFKLRSATFGDVALDFSPIGLGDKIGEIASVDGERDTLVPSGTAATLDLLGEPPRVDSVATKWELDLSKSVSRVEQHAKMNPRNGGDGRIGRLLNSGWYCVAK